MIQVTSNLTDQGEATTVNFSGQFNGTPTVPIWNNGFTASNSPNLTTCDHAGATRNVTSYGLPLDIPVSIGGVHLVIPYVFPFTDTFQYSFPINGTWAVDNLSEPGGPGGGWAFDYLGPCV
jgi:hypothetical protein